MFKRHLLYVEDDMHLAKVQLRIFRAYHPELVVHHVTTASAAIYALRAQYWDVVLSDYNLADESNGGEILAYLRKEGTRAGIGNGKPLLADHFVYLSDDPACASHVHWLEKPVSRETLSAKLREVLA